MIPTWIARVSVPRIHRIQQATTHRTYNIKHRTYMIPTWIAWVGVPRSRRIQRASTHRTYISFLTHTLPHTLSFLGVRKTVTFCPTLFLSWVTLCPTRFLSCHKVDRKKLPGGVSYLLCSLIKNPEKEDPLRNTWYRFFEAGVLPPGSWSGNIVNRKTPRGEGSFDQSTT